jgi:methionyl-tRNA synthetase
LAETRAHHEVQAISRALDAIWRVIADANRYFAGEQPWSLKTTNPARMATVLYVTAEVLRQIGILIQPYMPGSAAKLLDSLAVTSSARSFAGLGQGDRLQPDVVIPPPQAIFPRFIEEQIPQSA